jgi:predicted RNA polymerase sigma factor
MIVACHAEAEITAATDWRRIARLYATLALRVRSPILELPLC